jgi:hypothetical protein
MPSLNKKGRYYANLSPYYFWMLVIEAWLKNRSLAEEAGSLLQAKLMERVGKRDEMLAVYAEQLKISKEELTKKILEGTIEPNLPELSAEEQPEK